MINLRLANEYLAGPIFFLIQIKWGSLTSETYLFREL